MKNVHFTATDASLKTRNTCCWTFHSWVTIVYYDAGISAIRSQIRVILHIFQCACAEMPYFYFRSEIWRHCRIQRPQFHMWCENSGDARTFKAEIAIVMFSLILRTFWPKMAVFGGKISEGVVQCWPSTNSFLLLGVVTSVPLFANIVQEMRPRQSDTNCDRGKLNS